jgi:hypothetical protein
MGIGIVLIIWAVVGFALASLGSVVMMAAAKLLTRRAGLSRHTLILAVGIFPFVCLGWAGTVFVFQAVVNEVFLHRDASAGDSWTSPLPNGYAISLIDTMDNAALYDPKTQKVPDAIGSQDDTVFGVRLLQISGQYILGAASNSEGFPSEHSPIDHYFLIDGKARARQDFASMDALKRSAARIGVQVNLEPAGKVYSKYRFTWFDVFAGFLFLAPLAVYGFVLLWWLIRLRRTTRAILQTV